jgi:hypothetical protein
LIDYQIDGGDDDDDADDDDDDDDGDDDDVKNLNSFGHFDSQN